MFSEFALALLQVQVPGVAERRFTNIFDPLASPAEYEAKIGILTIIITGLIFVVVGSLIAYTIYKFRRRPGDDVHQEPPQVYGSNQIEIAWTVIPILIVFILAGVTARVVAGVQDPAIPKSALNVRVIGHQWWWEVQYPDLGFTTANEIHMPVVPDAKSAVFLDLESVDVIHSFWVPQLSGKTDLIPNRRNSMWIDPRQKGVYVGNCAEYCGTQHANMLLRVIVEDPNDFRIWADSQKQPAAEVSEVAEGKTAFQSLSCISCHVVRGTSAMGKFGPDLTHVGSRQTLGAGVLTNNRENLRAWINDPQDPKPGCFMPSLKLTNEQLDQVVAYLETLK